MGKLMLEPSKNENVLVAGASENVESEKEKPKQNILEAEDDEEDVLPLINCEYYTCDDFLKNSFGPDKNFLILHY